MADCPRTEIVLSTINARYSHTALALRYLYANLQELQPRAKILEFTLAQAPEAIAASLLAEKPRVIALGVYIWNSKATTELVRILKRTRPDIVIVLGGPEISYETETHPAFEFCDTVIRGEADFLFYEFCRGYLEDPNRPFPRIISGALPAIESLVLPYRFYTDEDVRHRVMYVEASRGCPFRCEYCLSSLDTEVRAFPLQAFLNELDLLIARGARRFKFLDRTFNLKISTCLRILGFFLERMHQGLFLHFEMIPDRLPEELKGILAKFPSGSLQFEIGIQTWNPEIARRISRRQDYQKLQENFRYLLDETHAHLHADLIAGLPGETLESFAHGFDQVARLGPHEIQLGLLKRLRGTPIARHTEEWAMVYEAEAPYRLLSSKTLDAATVDRVARMSKNWDRIANSGRFSRTMEILRELASRRPDQSLFWLFFELSDFMHERHPRGYGLALSDLAESLWIYLTTVAGISDTEAGRALAEDYAEGGKRDLPRFLFPYSPAQTSLSPNTSATPDRQRRFLESRSPSGSRSTKSG